MLAIPYDQLWEASIQSRSTHPSSTTDPYTSSPPPLYSALQPFPILAPTGPHSNSEDPWQQQQQQQRQRHSQRARRLSTTQDEQSQLRHQQQQQWEGLRTTGGLIGTGARNVGGNNGSGSGNSALDNYEGGSGGSSSGRRLDSAGGRGHVEIMVQELTDIPLYTSSPGSSQHQQHQQQQVSRYQPGSSSSSSGQAAAAHPLDPSLNDNAMRLRQQYMQYNSRDQQQHNAVHEQQYNHQSRYSSSSRGLQGRQYSSSNSSSYSGLRRNTSFSRVPAVSVYHSNSSNTNTTSSSSRAGRGAIPYGSSTSSSASLESSSFSSSSGSSSSSSSATVTRILSALGSLTRFTGLSGSSWISGTTGRNARELGPRRYRRSPRATAVLHQEVWTDLDTYDDLLALDQYNVKRGVCPPVLHGLPCRHPSPVTDTGERCHICMEAFTALPQEQLLLQLPCKHEYCRECIGQWLRDHPTCPVCRWTFPEEHTRLLHHK